MLAAAPMDREDDLARALVNVGDDVRVEGAQKLLAGAHRHAGRVPGRFEIVGQARRLGLRAGGCRRQPFKPCFAGFDSLERGFPALLKLGSDQTIVGIARRIAAFGQRGLVPSLLQLEISDALSFVSAFHPPSLSFQRGLDGHRFHDEEDLPRDRRLNPRAAESQAPGSAQHLVGAIATIDRPARASSRIGHRQPPSAAPAGEEPGQEGASASPGLWAAHQAIGVRGELCLVPIKFSPIDVTLVVILEQDLPVFKGSAVAVALAGAALDDLDPCLAFAVGVGPGVEGVLQNRDDVAVADRRPIERDQLLAVRRSGKVDLIGRRREMHAASAAELPKSLEDLTDGFLDAQIRIEAEAEIAMPDVSDRHADVAGEAVRAEHRHYVNGGIANGIPQAVQAGPVQTGTTVALIPKDVHLGEGMGLGAGPISQSCELAVDGLLPFLALGRNRGKVGGGPGQFLGTRDAVRHEPGEGIIWAGRRWNLGMAEQAAVGLVEPLGSVTGANRDGADRPGRRRRGALTGRHRAGPPWEPPRQPQSDSADLRCSTPTSTPTRGCMTGAGERDSHRKVQPMDCVRMVHARRKFFEIAELKKAPIAIEAVRRIDALFAIEREINGMTAEGRRTVRANRSRPLVTALEAWLREHRAKLLAKSEVAKAIDYLLKRWSSFTGFLEDGRICLSNNAAERAIRGIAVGRRNWTFAGSDAGGRRAAAIYTLIETAKLNDVDPHAWLADVLTRLPDHPALRLHELLPWAWKTGQIRPAAA